MNNIKKAGYAIICASSLQVILQLYNILQNWDYYQELYLQQLPWIIASIGFLLAGVFLISNDSKDNLVRSDDSSESNAITVGDWMITYLILSIPIVNIVMLFVYAFGSGTHPSKANWAKASLIWFAIATVLYIVLLGSIFAALM